MNELWRVKGVALPVRVPRLAALAILVAVSLPLHWGAPVSASPAETFEVVTKYVKDLQTNEVIPTPVPNLTTGQRIEIFLRLKRVSPEAVSPLYYMELDTRLESPRWTVTYFYPEMSPDEYTYDRSRVEVWTQRYHSASEITIRLTGTVPEPKSEFREPRIAQNLTGYTRSEFVISSIKVYSRTGLGQDELIQVVDQTVASITSEEVERAYADMEEALESIPEEADITPVARVLKRMADYGHPGWAAEVASALAQLPFFSRVNEYCNATVCAPMQGELLNRIGACERERQDLSSQLEECKSSLSSCQSARSHTAPMTLAAAAAVGVAGAIVGHTFGRKAGESVCEEIRDRVADARETLAKISSDLKMMESRIGSLYAKPEDVKETIREEMEDLHRLHRDALKNVRELRAALSAE